MQNSTSKIRVAITGIGVVSPVGTGVEKAWNNLKNGVSGIDHLKLEDPYADITSGFEVKIGAQVKDFNLSDFFPETASQMEKDIDLFGVYAIGAAKQAIDASNLMDALGSIYKPEEVSTIIGSGIGGMTTFSHDMNILATKGVKRIGVRTIFRLMPNAAAGQIGINFGFRGLAKSESTACASGSDALLSAYHMIISGRSRVSVAGGSEAGIMSLSLSSFNNMRALSRRNCPPEEASAPFSADRDGFVMGEGAVVYVLEEMESAKQRGATIYGELAGGMGTCDAYHITAPHPEGQGATNAMLGAMHEAGVKPDEIGYIHAHGTSTPLNDARETLAIKKAFGDHAEKIAISSTKSMTGHMIGAAGPMGVFAALMGLNEQVLPPTINLNNPDPECDLDYIPNKARKVDGIKYAMINALGFGGHNTSLIVRRYDG